MHLWDRLSYEEFGKCSGGSSPEIQQASPQGDMASMDNVPIIGGLSGKDTSEVHDRSAGGGSGEAFSVVCKVFNNSQ